MRLAELAGAGIPAQEEVAGAGVESARTDSAAPPPEESVTETTPSGLEILYSWAPKRLYRINGTEVPSVTTVLGVLDKSGPLTWWGQGVGVEGVLELYGQEVLRPDSDGVGLLVPPWGDESAASKDNITALLTKHKLTVNHVKDRAADRGVNVHGALETWAAAGGDTTFPIPLDYEEHERGYVDGLRCFMECVYPAVSEVRAEVMVGSLEHLYAGRYDLRLTLAKPVEVKTRCYPKKAPKIETIPAGSYLCDLKTSKRCYPTHLLQLEAYEQASVECGYGATDYRAVIHVTAEGQYEFIVNDEWTFDDFATVRACYAVMHERAKVKNEREVEQALRDELGAKELT